MARMVARCGLICSDCPAHIARLNNDDTLRKSTAADWSKMYGADVRPEHVDCDGCTVPEGVHTPHCYECEMRSCGTGKGVANCGLCADYPACATIAGFLEMVPAARAVLDGESKRRV